MSDENTSTTDETTETTETTSEETTESTETTEVSDKEETQVPAHIQKELEKARAEAAKYRVRAREAEEAAKKTAGEEFTKQVSELSDAKAALTADVEAANLRNTKVEAALDALLPEDKERILEFAGLLQGKDAKELSAHAEKVSKLFGATPKKSRATDPSQGASGSAKPNVGTGLKRLQFAYSSAE